MQENKEVLELYRKIKAFGADMVFKFMDISLTSFEAEDLMEKLTLIEDTVREIEA